MLHHCSYPWRICSEITLYITLRPCVRISTEHSPKLQIRSHSYLRAVSEVSINRSLDTLNPKTLLDPKLLLSSPQYRSRNESYMRAMSTISQVGSLWHLSIFTKPEIVSHLLTGKKIWFSVEDRFNILWHTHPNIIYMYSQHNFLQHLI